MIGITLGSLLGSLLGCTRVEFYEPDALKQTRLGAKSPGQLKPHDATVLRYRLILETAYYSPGALVQENGDEITVRIVRCPLGTQCKVDLESKPNPDGSQELPLRAGTKRVRILGKKGSVLVMAH